MAAQSEQSFKTRGSLFSTKGAYFQVWRHLWYSRNPNGPAFAARVKLGEAREHPIRPAALHPVVLASLANRRIEMAYEL